MEVWCECFGKERQNFRKTDSYELESIIQKIGGWKKYEGNSSGKLRIPGYGVQRVLETAMKSADKGTVAVLFPMFPLIFNK